MSERTRTALTHIEIPAHARDLYRNAQTRLNEAEDLARAIDLEIVYSRIINLKKRDAGHLLGIGHLEELQSIVKDQSIDLLIVNHTLSPVQQRNLERFLKIKVIDRTGLILEIFGERAATREGRLQVDAAHLRYQKSRLVRSWTHLERQRGGRGFLGGPGETQIEADRRALDTQIQAIEARLEEVRRTRSLHRANRKRNATPVIALVGYTNAGKSTLFNRLSASDVLAKNMLFATLDPVMRNIRLPSGREVVLSDTVGFVSELPTELVAAFRATLEEVAFADIILHVRDASHPEQTAQAKDVWDVLEKLGIDREQDHPKILEVLNKIDLKPEIEWLESQYLSIKISAQTGQGVDRLLEKLDALIRADAYEDRIRLGHGDGEARAWLYARNLVKNETVDETGIDFYLIWNDDEKAEFASKYTKQS